MTCYPLINLNSSSKLKMPTHTLNNEDYVRLYHDLYLTDEAGQKFRLHSTRAHSMDEYLGYEIKCPHCGALLTPVGAPINYYDLGLYTCKNCGKH